MRFVRTALLAIRRCEDTPRNRRRALFAIALLATALRLAYVAEVHDHPYYLVPLVDAADYHARAMAVMRGEGLGSQAYYKAPAYEWLVGQVYRVVGPRLEVVYALQMLGGVATAVLTAALGMRWFGLGAGVVGGALSGLYVQLPYFENQLLIESSALFLSVLAVFLFERGGRVWFDLAAGVAAGVALQLRPVNVALVAALLGSIWLQRRVAAVRLRRTASLLAPVLLLLVPTIRHNRLASGHLVPVSVNGGINFYIGNNPDYDETVAIRPGLRWEALTERFDSMDDPVRWQRNFYDAALAFIRSQPLAYTRLLGKKLILFWGAAEIDRNQDSAAMLGDSTVLRGLGVRWSVIAVLGLVGMACSWRTARRLPLLALVFVQMLGVLAFFVTSRYRLVVVPWLALAAGAACATLVAAGRAGHRRTLVALGAVAAVAVVAVVPDHMAVGRSDFGRPDFDRAEVLARRGDRLGALRAYEREVRRHPDDPDVRFRYGEHLERLGCADSARVEYRLAMRLAPWSYKPPLALGTLEILTGVLDSAAVALQEAVRRGDPHGRSLYDLGLVREKQGRFPEALALYQRSLEKPDDLGEQRLRRFGAARTLILLGRDEAAEVELATAGHLGDPRDVPIERAEAQLRAGDPHRALASVEQVADAGSNPRLAFVRARALLALGRRDAAIEEGRRAAALDPSNRRYRDWLATLK